MTPRQRWIVGASAFVVIAIMSLPLALVLPMALPDDSGVSSRQVQGSVWDGTLRDASVAGLPLGDTRLGFDFLPFFVGEARLGFATPTLRGIIALSSGRIALSKGNGMVDLAGRLRPLPVSRFTLDAVAAEFREDRCVAAQGRVRAEVAGEVGGLSLPGGMSGAVRCDGRMLLIPLVGQSGMERIDLRVAATGDWRADLAVRTSDPAVAAKLLSSGFASGPAGYSIRVTGAL